MGSNKPGWRHWPRIKSWKVFSMGYRNQTNPDLYPGPVSPPGDDGRSFVKEYRIVILETYYF